MDSSYTLGRIISQIISTGGPHTVPTALHYHRGPHMYDNYDDAAGATITRRQAMQEVVKHNLYWTDFVHDCGDHSTYSGRVILDWLGY